MCAARNLIDSDVINFTEDEIETITSGYTTLIGQGGFGEVYRGVLDNDDLVAVKKYIRRDLIQEFMEEVKIHSQIGHKNIVKIIGYCRGENNLIMVTEFISNGNLEDILHKKKFAMSLDTRLGIAIGCAEALSYMHSMHLSTHSLVCHGDIKPANILLNDNLTAKISDFGLSRLLLGGITRHTVNVKGSIDYMDPTYLQTGCLTPRSDVYSFGLVLLELITRKRVKEWNISLIGTFSKTFLNRKVLFRELFDAELVNDCNLDALEKIVKLANKCLNLDIDNRPRVNVVAEELLELWKGLRGGQRLLKMSLGIFKRNAVNSAARTKLQNVKVFPIGELIRVTQNYSYVLDKSSIYEIYKGKLEDNTLVAVVKYYVGYKLYSSDKLINAVMIMSQVVHKNIIKLLGYCFEDNHPILVFEASKRHLTNILHENDDHLPLDLRLKIAVQTAQALVYIQSPSTGVSHHGLVVPSNILLDDNFVPKVTSYLLPLQRKDTDYHHYMDPKSAQSDVYSFGIVLMELVSRKKPVYENGCHLINKFRRAYKIHQSGKEMFDEEISSEDGFIFLEEIGRLAVMCTRKKVSRRPTMEKVAECLEILRRSWKKLLDLKV